MTPTVLDYQFWRARQADRPPNWARRFADKAAKGPTIHDVITARANGGRLPQAGDGLMNAISLFRLARRNRGGDGRAALVELITSPHRHQWPLRTQQYRRWFRRLEAR